MVKSSSFSFDLHLVLMLKSKVELYVCKNELAYGTSTSDVLKFRK